MAKPRNRNYYRLYYIGHCLLDSNAVYHKKTAAREAKGPKLQNGERQQPLKASDNMRPETTSSTMVASQTGRVCALDKDGIQDEEEQEFGHQKETIEKRNFVQILEETIPMVSEEPVKCLGKW